MIQIIGKLGNIKRMNNSQFFTRDKGENPGVNVDLSA